MYIWTAGSAVSVFKNTRMRQNDSSRITLHAARGMEVSAQILLREYADFDITDVTVAGLPDDVRAEIRYQDYITYNDGIPYPDILSRTAPHVKAQTTQGVWVTFFVGENAVPGARPIQCTVRTSAGDFTAAVVLTVYPAVLPTPAESAFGHEYFFNPLWQFGLNGDRSPAPLPEFYDFDRFSDEWWALMAEYAKTMKRLRVNSLHVVFESLLIAGGSTRVSEDEWSFDFTVFDRFVGLFLENGSFRYITMSAPIRSVTGGDIGGIGYDNKHESYKIFEPDAEKYARALLTAVRDHFTEKGWLPMLTLRLEDEPHTTEYWKWLRDIVREILPGVPCGEPLDMHQSGKELAGYCDVYIPRLEVYDEGADFYRARQAAGDTVWCYSCCFPEEPWYLNKFIDLPASYSRLIKWACFSRGITGFLHWGFNYWSMNSLYGLGGDARFKGDGFIVYPDVENSTLKMSARGINTTEGIEDWELLHMLAKKDEAAACAIAHRIAAGFTTFTDDARAIEAARAEVLELLTE